MLTPIRVFIGHDHVENVAFHVLVNSIMRNTSLPVAITPISLKSLGWIFTRERDPKQSNEFSFSRWLVPFLCNYQGHAIFMDCDMVCLGNLAEIWGYANNKHAVHVVKHEYTPRDDKKYLGTVQYPYPKKNWSSVMLFNNEKCQALQPSFVNSASGLELHQFKWLQDESLIGALPAEWNHLVGEYAPNPKAKLVHYTNGGPYFNEYKNCDYAKNWFDEFQDMTFCEQL